jgi:hypothetical protein
MKRWLCIVIPLIVLSLLINWRLGEKRAENAAQNAMRAKRMNEFFTMLEKAAKVTAAKSQKK